MGKGSVGGSRHAWREPAIAALAGVALMGAGAIASAANLILTVQQGTQMSAVPGVNGQLVTDLAGRLWTLPEAGGTATPLTAMGEYARRPRLSPDGSTLAYESLRDGHYQIMLMDAEGKNSRPVTQGPWNHLSPAWSPDGQRLAFSSDRGGDFSIWELELESQATRQISFEPGDELDPAWNPGAASMAYINDWNGRSALVVRAQGQSPRTLVTSERALRAPAWRPDGSVISYVASLPQGPRLNMVILAEPLAIKPVSGSEAAFPVPATWLDRNRLLYTAEGQIRTREIAASARTNVPFEATLSVTPASQPPPRQVAAISGPQQVRGLGGFGVLPGGHLIVSALGDLWEVDAQGAQQRRLSSDDFVDRDPAISADGQWLAFVSDRDGAPQLWLLNLTNGETRALTAERSFVARPAWNRAGDAIAYLAGEPGNLNGGSFSLKTVSTNSRATAQVSSGLIDPGTPAWSADDAWLGVVQRPQGQPQLLLFAADGSSIRRITLPVEAAGAGPGDLQWSPDGKSLLIASSAGIRSLPILSNGLVGADWRGWSGTPAQIARWTPDQESVFFTDTEGLAKAGPDGAVTRIPLAINWQPVAATGTTIIRASRVFDGTGTSHLFDHEIVLQGNRIQHVRPWTTEDSTEVAGATVIDARGKTVLPGLIDLGVRFTDGNGGRRGRALLAFGITTVQVTDMSGTQLREVSESWLPHAAGPRLLHSPQWCGEDPLVQATVPGVTTGGLRLCAAALGQLPTLAEPLRQAGTAIWSPSWVAALSGLVQVISPGLASGPAPLLEAGQVTGSYYQDAVEVMARSGVVVVPALAPSGMAFMAQEQPDLLASRQYLALYRDEERAAQESAWEAAVRRAGANGRNQLRQRQRALGQLVAGGGHLATASNSPAVPYGLGLHAEIRLLTDIGLGNAEVLRMATAEAAQAAGLREEIGRIAPGLLADLLIVDGDPLYDIRHLLRIDTVITDGSARPIGTLLPGSQPLEKFTTAAGKAGP